MNIMTCETCPHFQKAFMFLMCNKFKLAYLDIATLEYAGKAKDCERLLHA